MDRFSSHSDDGPHEKRVLLTEIRSLQEAIELWVDGDVPDSTMTVWLLIQLHISSIQAVKSGGLVLPGGLNVKGPR